MDTPYQWTRRIDQLFAIVAQTARFDSLSAAERVDLEARQAAHAERSGAVSADCQAAVNKLV